jgi:hypothetical protein
MVIVIAVAVVVTLVRMIMTVVVIAVADDELVRAGGQPRRRGGRAADAVRRLVDRGEDVDLQPG